MVPHSRYDKVIDIDITAAFYKGISHTLDISNYLGKFSISNTEWWPMGVKVKLDSPTTTANINVTTSSIKAAPTTSAGVGNLYFQVDIAEINHSMKLTFTIKLIQAFSGDWGTRLLKYVSITITNNFGSSYVTFQPYIAKKADYTANAEGKYNSTTPIITLPTPNF